jgi:hypothetical protein
MLPPRNPEPDPEMLALQRSLQVAEGRRRRARRFRSTLVAIAFVGLAALGIFDIYLLLLNFSPWPPLTTIMHIAAYPNCDATRAVGLAPARRGQPGYWPHNDADNDGIACEPLNGQRLRTPYPRP